MITDRLPGGAAARFSYRLGRQALSETSIRSPAHQPSALIIVPASDAHLESKASALACRSKVEALDRINRILQD
ncbi:hypothetical protein THSYN_21250 [Candidatus Thiodictyon syntrophicum]|uniref:Uncharacterized protein n=2 Tax=Candidatus Thiodictyon syntrophicum TaxID=1166950 RepID=A0A2K8UCA5_9GAMM|nr:hypothetical protein THSYN_21250 [Candidatus Thiodictyon syntrophicum]